jgi:small-conductance mechanosensitive channel
MTLSVVMKLVLTVAVVVGVLIVGAMLRLVANALLTGDERRPAFWTTQALRLLTLAGVLAAVLIVWRDKLSDLGAVGGWFAVGLTVALQRVVTAFAGYLIILRGNLFTIGDRITIGGVRGDVVSLGFMQTTVMEMGQPPGEQGDSPSMWVRGRQPT